MSEKFDLNELLADQATNFDTIRRNLEAITADREMSIAKLAYRLDYLDGAWQTAMDLHLRIRRFNGDADYATLPYFQDKEFDAMEAIYIDICSEAKARVYGPPTLQHPPVSNAAVNVATFARDVSPCKPKVPPIDLPQFSGSYREWQTFHDYFETLFKNDNFNDLERLHYLKKCLKGEAAHLIHNIATCATSFDIAWNRLETRYSNKKCILNAHLSELFSLKSLNLTSAVSLRNLLDSITSIVDSLQLIGRPTDKLSEDILVYLTVQKIDPRTRDAWKMHATKLADYATFKDLTDFLNLRVLGYEGMSSTSKTPSTKSAQSVINHQTRVDLRPALQSVKANANSITCPTCHESHPLYRCAAFKEYDVDKRYKIVRDNKICVNCLTTFHRGAPCKSKNVCAKCRKRHNTLLHRTFDDAKFKTNSTNPIVEAKNSLAHSEGDLMSTLSGNQSTSTFSTENVDVQQHFASTLKIKPVLLATAWVYVTTASNRSLKIRALLDQGSTHTFIAQKLVNVLRAKTYPVNARVSVIGDKSVERVRRVLPIFVSAVDQNCEKLKTDALIVEKLTSYAPRFRCPSGQWPHLRGLKLADDSPTDESPIQLIIGADLYAYTLCDGIRRGQVGEPVAQETIFGWILSGNIGINEEKPVLHVHHVHSLDELSQQIAKFWEIEELPKCSPPSEEDSKCERHFLSTFSRTLDGRFVVRIPFRFAPPLPIGETRARAERILLAQERRALRRPDERKQYLEFLHEYETLGHMRVAPSPNQNQVVYLPHHAVRKETSMTTKVRVVFNASSPSSNQTSLNDLQMSGPKLQQDLTLLLTKWRFYRVVACADIEKMFRQILVDERDLDYQRILWRSEMSQAIREYQLQTVTYGTTSAPYLALRVIRQLALDDGHRFPQAAKVLMNQTYVDDCLIGADSIVDLRQLRNDLIALLKRGCFSLRKWSSNQTEALSDIDPSNHGLAVDKTLRIDESLKILGIVWNPSTDTYRFTTSFVEMPSVSKRAILSIIARLFDPLGWLAPVVVVAKIFMKSLWKLKLDWDDPIPVDLASQWIQYYTAIPLLQSVHIPRWVNLGPEVIKYSLQGFSDASSTAYAAVVYLRVELTSGEITTHLLASKSRVAPEKLLTIPRLELCGAVLLAQLLNHFRTLPELIDTPVRCWVDATIVLAWLNQESSHWKTFVGNRVSTIHTLLDKVPWGYVDGLENPADLATRGVQPGDIASSTVWWEGPSWLRQPESSWRSETPPLPDQYPWEEKTILLSNIVTECQELSELTNMANDFSSWPRLLRVTAYILRWSPRFKDDRKGTTLSAHEIVRAEMRWVSLLQQTQFPNEIVLLEKNEMSTDGLRHLSSSQPLSKKSSVRRLNPVLDQDGLLRVGGRLVHSQMPLNEKFPFILKSHHITKLLIREAHHKCLHGGIALTLSTLRTRFWVLQARKLVKTEVYNCVACARIRAELPSQLMGSLPPARVNRPAHAFADTGVDYAGPVRVRMAGGRGVRAQNAYIAVFVCLATKAIHLELVTDYTSPAFLAAFDRFTSRRGLPANMFSDRGTNFVGAVKELRAAYLAAIEDEKFQAHLLNDRIKWHFVPPAAPHFGGLWEAGVKAMKNHLKRVLANVTPTYEELNTLLCRIEACLNSRPLSPMDDSSESLDVLTPAHFILGHPVGTTPSSSLEEVPCNRLSRWQHCRQLLESFWRCWSEDYVRSCQHRTKWQNRSESLRSGTMVLLRDENLPPTKWHLGRILRCHPGPDGLIRVVTVKTENSTLVRPITKLALLPVCLESD